ncbi:MAG: hypothetical protein AB4080_13535 [Trichodesmium sp.]
MVHIHVMGSVGSVGKKYIFSTLGQQDYLVPLRGSQKSEVRSFDW